MRTPRYQQIAESLRAGIQAGEPPAGRLLPSEAELSEAYAASRVTVRRALDLLREEGLVASRQGLGWFVAADPLRQPLGRLTTLEDQLASAGLHPRRRIVEDDVVEAAGPVADALGATDVRRVRRVNLADEEPFAVVTVWCPVELAGTLTRGQIEDSSFHELLAIELAGARQTIGAAAASPADAGLLGVPAGAPTLVCRRLTRDVQGRAVLYSEFVFAAHRTEFVVDLPRVAPSIAPSGFQLRRA